MKNVLTGKPLLALSLVLISGAVWFFAGNREYVYRGSSYSPYPKATNFELVDQNGKDFELVEHLDQVVLLFFGYTNCPDVCPTTLADYGRMRDALGDKSDQVVFVFITEDPERDTREKLKDYLSAFDHAIIGLTGGLEELQPIWDAYHVIPQVGLAAESGEDGEGHDENYMVGHSSRIFVIDGTGHLRLTFPYEMEVSDMLQDVLHLIEELE